MSPSFVSHSSEQSGQATKYGKYHTAAVLNFPYLFACPYCSELRETTDGNLRNWHGEAQCFQWWSTPCDVVCRIGVSRLSTDIDELGNVNSWGYGSTGKKSTGKIYSKYPSGPEGRTYGPGDEIACFVEVSQDDSAASQQSSSRRRGPNAPGSGSSRGSAIISFAVNGECLGPAFTLHQSAEQDKALFPHVLVKNLLVLVRFRGERPLHWPQDKPWDGTWCGCLPWQVGTDIGYIPLPCLG